MIQNHHRGVGQSKQNGESKQPGAPYGHQANERHPQAAALPPQPVDHYGQTTSAEAGRHGEQSRNRIPAHRKRLRRR